MTNRRQFRRLPLVLLLGLLTAAVLFGCDTINEPDYNNPLDPDNPGSVDPFQLEASYGDGWVKLEWEIPEGPAIDQIIIDFVEYAGDVATSTPIDTLVASENSYFHGSPLANQINYYRLKAMDASERVAQTSHVVPAALLVPPIVNLPAAPSSPSSGIKIYTADQAIEVLASVGDIAQVDTLEDFSTMPIVPLEDGVAQYDHVRLLKQRYGSVVANSRQLYVRAGVIGATDTAWSEPVGQLIQQELNHSLTKSGGGATVAEPFVDVIQGNAGRGIDSVRFASSAEGLATAIWRPVQASYDSLPLLDTPNEQAIYAQYASTFGDLVDEDPLVLTADDLTTASVTPDLPANGIVSGIQVKLDLSAVATEMRVSTDVGFSDTDWQPYADELMLTLADESGTQNVYTQFRNHWYQTMESLVTTLEVSASVLDLAFTNLADGMAVSGGDSIGVAGTVGPVPDGYRLASVEVNTGNGFTAVDEPDGGWASPTAAWETPWRIPRKTEDTPFLLGVHAVAEEIDGEGVRSGTLWIEVVISQLVLTLDEPEDGDEIITGDDVVVTIEGTAIADLTAAPLDSVVVTAGETTLVVTEDLEEWSVDWQPPVVDAATDVTITAIVHAGEETDDESVSVTLLPPAEEEEEE